MGHKVFDTFFSENQQKFAKADVRRNNALLTISNRFAREEAKLRGVA